MTLQPGSRLGTYRLSALIGAGGMGEVYRVSDTKLGRDVAIKVLPDEFSQDADRLARIEIVLVLNWVEELRRLVPAN